MSVIVLCLVVLLSPCVRLQEPETEAHGSRVLGALIYEYENDLKEVLNLCGSMYNFKILIKELSAPGQILEVSKHVCDLAAEGVLGIIDGVGGRASENIQAITDSLELPHVLIQQNDVYSESWSLLNFYPSPSAYNEALKQLIIQKDWTNFTILYVKGYSILRVSDLLEMGNSTERYTIAVRELSGNDYRDVLINSKENGYTNFVVDCPSAYIDLILDHAQQVGLMADEHSYIFVSPDLFSLDLDNYRYGGVNMTGFRLTNLTDNHLLWGFLDLLQNQTSDTTLLQMQPEEVKTKMVLIHDVVLAFNSAMETYRDRKLDDTMVVEKLDCKIMNSWAYGTTLLNFVRTNKIHGITGPIMFDGQGLRSKVAYDILELSPAGNETIGQWLFDKLVIERTMGPDAEIGEENIMNNKSLKVLIALTEPYAFVKESQEKLVGNDRYEGFTIDLIDTLSKMLGFSYEFEVEPVYGDKVGENEFTGMVKQLREDKADLAICDLTVTKNRQDGIDFSTPFMTLGISILYKEPSKQPPEMFSFMAVFSTEVWIYMMLIQLCLGIVMIFVGRISNKEWQNPVPCIEQPDELTNQFSFANSVWLIIGSVMQQGSEIAPIALAPRMITSVWWFFTLVMVASYVGTLVAFLTIEKNVLPFETVDDLHRQKSIAYGAKVGGSTLAFFRDSKNPRNKEMYNKMEKNGWIAADNNVGVTTAENSPYAFFMESTSIEYVKERHCDLIQVGGLLDTKTYGIGMKKQSPYKRYIDDALLKMKEHGDIQKLKNIWWKEKRGGGKCANKRDEEQKQLNMKNMLGAFVVLGGGCGVGLIVSTLDMLWGVFKRTIKYGTTFKYELIEELKFALSFSGNVKPVKRKPKTMDGSAEALAELEGKDEIHSLKSLGSGKSTSTHKTCHSHSSRHSSRSLSVAFARRRKFS